MFYYNMVVKWFGVYNPHFAYTTGGIGGE